MTIRRTEYNDEAEKLQRLREAVQVGIDAIARGEFTEFESMDDLERHLNALADKAISDAAR
jgi:antitoxin ParD1/3/4